MPPVPGRQHPVDLWLCGHHYRSSAAALESAGAMVEFLDAPENNPHSESAIVPEATVG